MYPLVMMHIVVFMNILDWTLNKVNRIAIVGASGSGKTTLFNMLERLYDYGGSIHVGDVELKDISIDTWRNAFRHDNARYVYFHASFEDNIRLVRPDASELDLEYAIDRASLRSVVERLPDGIHTIVGSGGHGMEWWRTTTGCFSSTILAKTSSCFVR